MAKLRKRVSTACLLPMTTVLLALVVLLLLRALYEQRYLVELPPIVVLPPIGTSPSLTKLPNCKSSKSFRFFAACNKSDAKKKRGKLYKEYKYKKMCQNEGGRMVSMQCTNKK